MRIKTRDNSKQKGRLIQKWKNKNDNTWNRLIITRILHLERDNDDKNHTTSNKGTKNGNQRQSTCQGEQRGGRFFFFSFSQRTSQLIQDHRRLWHDLIDFLFKESRVHAPAETESNEEAQQQQEQHHHQPATLLTERQPLEESHPRKGFVNRHWEEMKTPSVKS